ncbi:ComEC/Rec2 family competence protein [Mucilaginibacter angelicae]|uniref:ComEC/Rec2 family competence protein n=1 Tax=Mucilaginibacter angelicae TaxID=869718 RepID=A0ABV6L4U8_9SPHI
MKIYLISLLLTCCTYAGFAQQELRIHHINVKNGDATLIGIYDNGTQKYTRTMLIDGGSASPGERLLPYLKQTLNSDHPKLNYVALTHYHDDHYTGLLAIKDGDLQADSVIDQGGYQMNDIFPNQTLPDTHEVKPGAMVVYTGWTSALTKAVANDYVRGHVTGLFHYGNTAESDLGHKLLLGTIQGIPVTLECVAGWGNTLNGSGITSDLSPTRTNANNFSLAFILNYGQFRYFIGGDLGGDRKSPYIDQETPLTTYLNKDFPSAWSWNHTKQAAGHICGFKANHHGSEHSNSIAFIQGMSPAITVVSAGEQKSWKLPRPDYLQHFSDETPLSVWTTVSNEVYNKGIYVTNLYDFEGIPSKTTAMETFANKPGVSFDYGNATTEAYSSYMIKIKPDGINQKSQFQVYRVDNSGSSTVLLANFLCHSL